MINSNGIALYPFFPINLIVTFIVSWIVLTMLIDYDFE
jgi:hypothetical protein